MSRGAFLGYYFFETIFHFKTIFVTRAEKVSNSWQLFSNFFKTLLAWSEEHFEEFFSGYVFVFILKSLGLRSRNFGHLLQNYKQYVQTVTCTSRRNFRGSFWRIYFGKVGNCARKLWTFGQKLRQGCQNAFYTTNGTIYQMKEFFGNFFWFFATFWGFECKIWYSWRKMWADCQNSKLYFKKYTLRESLLLRFSILSNNFEYWKKIRTFGEYISAGLQLVD